MTMDCQIVYDGYISNPQFFTIRKLKKKLRHRARLNIKLMHYNTLIKDNKIKFMFNKLCTL